MAGQDFGSKVDSGRKVIIKDGLGRSDSEEEILSSERNDIVITTEMTVRSSSR